MTTLPSGAYIQFGPDHVPEVNATVRLAAATRMYCHTYPDSAPVVSVNDAHVRLSVGVPDPERVASADVGFARELAAVVARYVAELEHLAAAAAEPGTGSADRAA